MLWLLFASAAVLTAASAWYLACPFATGARHEWRKCGKRRSSLSAARLRGDEQRHQMELMRARLLGQLNELDAARADRGIDPAVAQDEALRLDAELLQVLKDIEALPPPAVAGVIHGERRRWRAALVVLALALPLIAAGLYGMQQAPILSALMRLADGVPPRASLPPEALKMVERLENRLREQPNDPAGWAQLGRSYAVMERRSDAQAAYAKAHELAPDNPEILSDYAWLLFGDNPDYTEEPAKALYERLLVLDPNHPDALWFLGLSAYNKSDTKQAVRYWERLTKVLSPDNPALPEVRRAIARVQEQAKQ